jgi:hypothetical protein
MEESIVSSTKFFFFFFASEAARRMGENICKSITQNTKELLLLNRKQNKKPPQPQLIKTASLNRCLPKKLYK